MQNALIYILFAIIPFWHLKLGTHITLYEVGLLMNLIMGPFFLMLAKSKFRWLDVLVLVYAVYGIVSVLVGSAAFYESARTYRYLTLGPVLLYFIIRFTPVSYDVIRRGLYFMAAGIFLQTLIVLRYVVTFKARPTGEAWFFFPMSDLVAPIVTLGVLCSLAVCALIYTRGEVKPAFKKAILYGGALVLAAGVFAAASRMVVVVFVLLFPFAGWLWKSKQRRRHLAVGVHVAIGVMLLAIFSPLIWDQGSNAKQATGATQNVEEGRSLERVVDVDLYQQDIGTRLRFWGNLVRSAMDDPVFGKGAASHEVGNEGGYGLYISSAHNILVSALYTSGFIGLVLLIMQIAAGYKCVSIVPADNKQLAALGKFAMIGFTVVLFVSFTNDLTAGRGDIFMFLLAIAAKLAYSPLRTK